MKLWVLLILPALALSLKGGMGGRERQGRRKGSRDEDLGETSEVCRRVHDQPPVSLAKRTQRAQVVFYGFVTRVYKKEARETYPAEFFIVNVFKGADIMAKLLSVNGGYGGVYNLRDKRINVTNFGPREACMAPLKEQRTFIILATSKSVRRLRAHYDHPGSAAVQWSKENEEEVWRALGWDGWSDWSGCSASCGSGTQERRRYCLQPDGCHGYNTERRRCNYFSCNGTLDVLHLPDKQYKPPKFGWRESSTRPGSWRAVKNRPLLVHTRDIYPNGFPKKFSILITIRPDLGNMGMLFIMHRAYGGEVYLGLGLGSGLELLHTGPATPDDVLPINVAPINVNLTDGHWHQLAISVMEDNAIQVYVDCRWISRQVLRRSTLEIPMDTLLYVGGMPGRSYQGEMEQFIISPSSDAVAKQCKPEPIPIIDESLQDTGRPLGLALQQQEQNNHIFPIVHHQYNGESDEYDYGEYGYDDTDYDDGDEYDNGNGEYDNYSLEEYDRFPNYVYDDYDDFEGEDQDRIPGTADWESTPTSVEEVEDDKEEYDDNERDDRRNEMKEMPGKGEEKDSVDPPDPSRATDDEDLIEGSGSEGTGRYALTWSVWSGCSTSCDGGVRIRSYRCLPGQPNIEECVHAGIETQEQKACNLQPCPPTTPITTTTTTTTTTPRTRLETITSDPASSSPRWASTEAPRIHHEKEIMMHNIPYITTTNVMLPSVMTTEDDIPVLSTPTTLPPRPPSPAGPTTTPKHVHMHPLFPTTVINVVGGHPSEPFHERNYVNTTQRFYSEAKPLKPTKLDHSMSKSAWQPQVGRDLNEVMPREERPAATAKKTASSWNRKWSYHYHHQHRMRHHHTKHQYVQNERECGGGCLNGGLCVYGGVCHCRGGWRGRRCEQAECGRGCMNGGVCIAPDTCRCPHGYTGTYCHDAMCTGRCLHGGVCTGVDVCTCPGGYTGLRCESAVCTPPCQHGGRCVAPGVCSCPSGYGGPLCQRLVCSHGCGVGGVCVGVERCRCGRGYTGPSCATPMCDPPCSNGGTCISPGVCSCPDGYSGLWCTVKKCKYVPKQVAYTRSYKKVVPQRVQTHCGAWGWKSCTSVRQVYQTVTQKFYRTVYTCSNSP